MEINIYKIIKSNKGITLISTIVTIIVLIILATVSLSVIFNEEWIFSRAEKAEEKYAQEKAREALEITLRDAQVMKCSANELSPNCLTDKINKVGSDKEAWEN